MVDGGNAQGSLDTSLLRRLSDGLVWGNLRTAARPRRLGSRLPRRRNQGESGGQSNRASFRMRQASDLRDVLWHRRDKLHLAAEFSNQASRRSTLNALSRHSGRPLDQQEKLLSKLK